MDFERTLPAPNEVFFEGGTPRPVYEELLTELQSMGTAEWNRRLERAHRLLLGEQVAFGLPGAPDRTHPTDWVPRIIPAVDWERLRSGAAQRLRAINEFLRRVEKDTQTLVPQEIIESSILYDTNIPARFGPVPVRQISFDIVATEGVNGWEYRVIEENAKMPVGLAPMTRRRAMSQKVFFPRSLEALPVAPLDGWLQRLGDALRAAFPHREATLAVVSGGPQDQFYLDHHIYAREMGAILATIEDLKLDAKGYLTYVPDGRRIDVVYERIDEDTLYGALPGLIKAHAEGKVHVLFAPNSEIIDDKGVYPFVPQMIREYLGEEPILQNVRTWSLALPEERKQVMGRFEEMVVKSRGGYGGKEVLIGPEASRQEISAFRKQVEADPVEYIAQEVIDFSTHVLCPRQNGEEFTLRDSYADYRILALAPDPWDPSVVEVVPGSLTRVAAPGRHMVNISSGGKMKDTWVLQGE